VLGPATPVVADHTSVVGVSDLSCGAKLLGDQPGTPLAPHIVNNGISSHRLIKVMKQSEVNLNPARHNTEVVVPRLDKGQGITRWPSALTDFRELVETIPSVHGNVY